MVGIPFPGMPDHVGIGVVHDDQRRNRPTRSPDRGCRDFFARISGARSYVATVRSEGMSSRSSSCKMSSRPPLKKYVTCAYFSVSAKRS